jgi:hypothetical protein
MSRISGLRTHYDWNPGSIASNGTEDQTVTVHGATMGDFVFVASNVDLENMNLYAHVAAKDTVSLHLHNTTGGPKDLGSMRVHLTVVVEGVM